MSLANEAEDGGIDFNHPFTPYDVQLEFMKTAYGVLQKGNGQVGILESPTGTGKSLSLICACLTWLRNFKKNQFEVSIEETAERLKNEPSWVVEQILRRKRAELTRRWEEREERLLKVLEKEKREEQRAAKRRRIHEPSSSSLRKRKASGDDDDEEDEFLLDWEGEDGAGVRESDSIFSKETRELMERVGLGDFRRPIEEEEDTVEEEVKIFYTSRTHSQLTQFVSELRRPHFPPSYPNMQASEPSEEPGRDHECVKHIPLSSRQKLCINPAVSRLGSLAAINDKCAELQKPKKPKDDGSSAKSCPFVPNRDNVASTHQFRDAALATVPDIEDVHQLGSSLQVCPYYASRTAIPGAEIVSLPYPLLLQKSARDALGIELQGSVVVIDEAHNIMDAVASVHASEIRFSELKRAREMLAAYAKRFGKKLKGENRVMVGQIARVVQGLTTWLDKALLETKAMEQGIVDPNSLLASKGIDQINMFALVKYIQDSKLAYKIEGYATRVDEKLQEEQQLSQRGPQQQQQRGKPGAASTKAQPVLHTLTSFLLSLTNLSTEGRIFFERLSSPSVSSSSAPTSYSSSASPNSTPDIKLSYLLLSPTHAFSSVASEARAIILAGGTMSPFQDYETHLFPTHPPEKITTLSCGHVIPPENLCVWTLAATSPGGSSSSSSLDAFEFSFQKRKDRGMIARLGAAVLNICAVVPDGVVVFFPSYGYLDEVVAAWMEKPASAGGGGAAAAGLSIWDGLQTRKAVFREAKGGSSDEVLAEYSKAILGSDDGVGDGRGPAASAGAAHAKEAAAATSTTTATTRGALLLSVVGGKMSEGINFSDRLGRCVVIVGLPYPNIASPEWKARMEYVESSTVARLLGTGGPGRTAASASASASATTAAAPSSSSSTLSTPLPTAAVAAAPPKPTPTREQALAAGKKAARDFYENACMRAVNQSIGRAIRHRGDYAAIVLLDRRFATARIRAKLPGWIRGGMVSGSEDKGLPGLMGALGGFFRGKKGVM